MDDDELCLKKLLTPLFTSRTRLAPLVRLWLKNPTLFPHKLTRTEGWTKIFRFIQKQVQFRITLDSIGVVQGPFLIPRGQLTSAENAEVHRLSRERKLFRQVSQDPTTRENILCDCRWDKQIDSIINRPALLREFIRAAFTIESENSATVDFADYFDFFCSFCRDIQRSMSDAGGIADQFDSMRQVLALIFNSYGDQRPTEMVQQITQALCTGMPSIQQMRLFCECFDGCFRMPVHEAENRGFIEAFNTQLSEMKFSTITLHHERENACLIITKVPSPIDQIKKAKMEQIGKVTRKFIKRYTETLWYRKREFMAALVRVIFGPWLKTHVKTWRELPRCIRYLLMSMPSVFTSVLNRLGRLSDTNWKQRLMMPYADPELYEARVNDKDIAEYNPISVSGGDAHSWRATIFFFTVYILGWHPESQQLQLNSWLAIMHDFLMHPNKVKTPVNASLKKTFDDIAAGAHALRALFHLGSDSCEHKILCHIDATFSQSMSAAMATHLPNDAFTETEFITPPAFGFTCEFSRVTVDQVWCALHAAHRSHEFLTSRWKMDTHSGIMFDSSSDVTLLDLYYTLLHRCGGSRWPSYSWRCFRLPNNSLMAVVPTKLFQDGCRAIYLIQRISSYANRLTDAQWKTPSRTKSTGMHSFHMLPLYPHLVQAFFSDNDHLVYTAILGIYSKIDAVLWKRQIVLSHQGVALLQPDTKEFEWYYKLPALIRALTDPKRDANKTRILHPYTHSFSSVHYNFDTAARNAPGSHFREDTSCFVTSLRSLLTCRFVHHMYLSKINELLICLETMPEFKAAVDADNRKYISVEGRANLILQTAIAAAKQVWGEQKNKADKDPPVSIRWPESQENPYHAHMALYDLILLPYMNTFTKTFIFNHVVVDKMGSRRRVVKPDGHVEKLGKPVQTIKPDGKVVANGDAWTNPTYIKDAQIQSMSQNEKKAQHLRFRPDVINNVADWRIMWELALVTEYGFPHVVKLRHEHLKSVPSEVESKLRILDLDLTKVCFLVDPRTSLCPFAILDNKPLWRENQMLIFPNPISSHNKSTGTLRPLDSPTDEFLEYLIAQAPNFVLTDSVDRQLSNELVVIGGGGAATDDPFSINSHWVNLELNGWKPAPFASTGSKIKQLQRMNLGLEGKDGEEKKSESTSEVIPQLSISPMPSPSIIIEEQSPMNASDKRKRKAPTSFQLAAAAIASSISSKTPIPTSGSDELRQLSKIQRKYWSSSVKS